MRTQKQHITLLGSMYNNRANHYTADIQSDMYVNMQVTIYPYYVYKYLSCFIIITVPHYQWFLHKEHQHDYINSEAVKFEG